MCRGICVRGESAYHHSGKWACTAIAEKEKHAAEMSFRCVFVFAERGLQKQKECGILNKSETDIPEQTWQEAAEMPGPCAATDPERYRSGHNGADSKSVCEQSHAGSNPALSANAKDTCGCPFFALVYEGIRTGRE